MTRSPAGPDETDRKPAGPEPPDEPDPLEAACRQAVAAVSPNEPVMAAADWHALRSRIGDATPEDAAAGIRTAFAKADPSRRFRSWQSFAGWINGAMRDRLAGPTRPTGKIADAPAQATVTEADLRRLPPDGWREPVKLWLASDRRQWSDSFGPPPDDPATLVPEGVWKLLKVSPPRTLETLP